jgi:aminoglycoside phosphotransferase (APT) family kinase protein
VPLPTQRDFDVTSKAIAGWLERAVEGARDVSIADLCVPATSGFSNETIMADLAWTAADGERAGESVAIRVKPMGYKVFMEADFEAQHRLLTVLDRETPVKVPPMLWYEEDESVLGAPFFVMRKVPGQPAPDQPNYNQGGWLFEASPEVRRRCWRNAIDALVTVHSVPTETVAFLVKPELGATGFDQIFEYWRRSYEWAAEGGEYRIAAAALEWMEANRPAEKPTALSWGDCRIANMLFHEGDVQACLDWEMLSLGGHQMDLGWWLHLDDFHSFSTPRLEGLGGRSETIELWEEGTGEKATDLHFYEVFAGFRFAVVLMRIASMAEDLGFARGDMARNNPVTHLLARYLDIEPPPPLESPY